MLCECHLDNFPAKSEGRRTDINAKIPGQCNKNKTTISNAEKYFDFMEIYNS